MENISKQPPLVLCLLVGLVLTSATCFAYGVEQEQTYPLDVQEFINDRVGCDHFRGEPRDFDESYKRKFGKQAEIEEAERAEFLEKMTEKSCFDMDKRLLSLIIKYRADKIISDKIDQYEFLDISSGVYVLINENFPYAGLIQKKLITKGFMPYNVEQYNNPELPVLTIQIGSEVDIHTAQRVIETVLKYVPKHIGVVLLPKTSHSYFASRIQIGLQPVGNYQVYLGDSIQKFLSPDITQDTFEKYAKFMEPELSAKECSKELNVCRNSNEPCLMMNVDTLKCDSSCQEEMFRKLYSVGVLPLAFDTPIRHFACIGYRKDKGGTEEGAKCLADLLGYKTVMAATAAYEPEGCYTYDRPYYIWAH